MKNKIVFIIGILSLAIFILMLALIQNPTWWQIDLILCVIIVFLASAIYLTSSKKPHQQAAKYIKKAITILKKMQTTKKSKQAIFLLLIKNDITYAVDKLDTVVKYYEKYDLKYAIERLNKIILRYSALSNNSEKLITGIAEGLYIADIKALEQILVEIREMFKTEK